MSNHTLLLYGGGIDSSALLAYLAITRDNSPELDLKVSAVFFRYGQKAEALEHKACEFFCNEYAVPLYVVDAPFAQLSQSAILQGGDLANDPKINILDGRNFNLVGLAGMLAAKIGAHDLAMGYHVEPVARPFPDATLEFVDAMNQALPQAFVHKLRIVAPFATWTRDEIFSWCARNEPQVLTHAHTCYEDVEGGCGQCSHCKLKAEILARI